MSKIRRNLFKEIWSDKELYLRRQFIEAWLMSEEGDGWQMNAELRSILETAPPSWMGRWSLHGLLGGVELLHWIGKGQRFSRADLTARRQFLSRWSQSSTWSFWLHVLTLPWQSICLEDESIQRQIQACSRKATAAGDEPMRWQQQITPARSLESVTELECDVLVVGTGAGGAVAAYELARRGLAVVMVEEGDYYHRQDFSGEIRHLIAKLYRPAIQTLAWGVTLIPIPVGRSVGGSTTINSGTCMRTPEAVLQDWQGQGLKDFTQEAMLPYFQAVEEILQVQPASVRFVGEIFSIIARGAQVLGMRAPALLSRNAEGCDGQGLCLFGCPSGAKQSTDVSFVPRALASGAFLYTGLTVDSLLFHENCVAGAMAQGRNVQGTVRLKVRARATIISAGALITPTLLYSQGIRHPWLGKNLSLHPAGVVAAYFPEVNFNHAATIPQGLSLRDLEHEGLVFEGGTPPLWLHGMIGPWRAEGAAANIARYQQTAYFGVMLKDSSRGVVRAGLERDWPAITYRMNEDDFVRFKRGIDVLVRLFLAAGATRVCIPGLIQHAVIENVDDLENFWRTNPSQRRFLMSAYHPLGTARIAASPQYGVCNPEHQVWGVPGLYVMDGSSVPSSLGANPQVTIMAMAMRASRLLADQLLQTEGA